MKHKNRVWKIAGFSIEIGRIKILVQILVKNEEIQLWLYRLSVSPVNCQKTYSNQIL